MAHIRGRPADGNEGGPSDLASAGRLDWTEDRLDRRISQPVRISAILKPIMARLANQRVAAHG